MEPTIKTETVAPLGCRQVCEALNIGRDTFYFLTRTKQLKSFVCSGRRILVQQSDLQDFINRGGQAVTIAEYKRDKVEAIAKIKARFGGR